MAACILDNHGYAVVTKQNSTDFISPTAPYYKAGDYFNKANINAV
jgi:hypothetical protein